LTTLKATVAGIALDATTRYSSENLTYVNATAIADQISADLDYQKGKLLAATK
jgi:hypothetical protein